MCGYARRRLCLVTDRICFRLLTHTVFRVSDDNSEMKVLKLFVGPPARTPDTRNCQTAIKFDGESIYINLIFFPVYHLHKISYVQSFNQVSHQQILPSASLSQSQSPSSPQPFSQNHSILAPAPTPLLIPTRPQNTTFKPTPPKNPSTVTLLPHNQQYHSTSTSISIITISHHHLTQ